jgi:putative cell wall-binding protein
VIVGGTSAVSSAVENALKAKLGHANVVRIAGTNRYETARLIAAETVRILKAGSGYDGTALVATGANFPDALGASPIAAAKGWPLYLINPTGVDSGLITAMKAAGVTRIFSLGGTSVVSLRVESELRAKVPCTTQRLAGGNRYDTARVIATYGVDNLGLTWDKVAIATGTNFPDALAGGVLQGKSNSVMLLTPTAVLDPGVAATLAANKARIREVRFLGGPSAISNTVRANAQSLLE